VLLKSKKQNCFLSPSLPASLPPCLPVSLPPCLLAHFLSFFLSFSFSFSLSVSLALALCFALVGASRRRSLSNALPSIPAVCTLSFTILSCSLPLSPLALSLAGRSGSIAGCPVVVFYLNAGADTHTCPLRTRQGERIRQCVRNVGEWKCSRWLVDLCIYIYTDIYVNIYTYMHTNTYKFICIYIHVYTYMHIYMYIYMYTHIYVHTCIYKYICKYINIYIYIYMYICEYIYCVFAYDQRSMDGAPADT